MISFCFRAQIALVAFVFLFGPIHANNWEPCGDWIAYNDEKCFKIIDDTLRTFDEAKDACATQEHTSTLAVIRSSDEQQFLTDYLFKTEQKVENFWIGAKYSSQNGSFIWIDNTPLNYTNWDAATQSSLNQPNYCVHMQAEERVVGKWKDGRCIKKNAVVCQRMQFWSTEFLQKKFLDSRRQQMDAFVTIQNLTQSLASANGKISSHKESLQNSYQRIDTLKKNLENVNQRVDELKQNYENAISNANSRNNEQKQNFENAISNANAKINEQKQNFENAISNVNAKINEQKQNFENAISNANARINEQKQSIDSANARIKEKQNFIPIGFLYTQLPKETTPSEIWPWMTWTDVSSEYAGVFFRMEGGQAAPFGSVQDGNSPHLIQVENSISFKNTGGNIATPIGEWSNPVVSGSWNWTDSKVYVDLKFLQSDGEVRPRNMAIRVWRRTG